MIGFLLTYSDSTDLLRLSELAEVRQVSLVERVMLVLPLSIRFVNSMPIDLLRAIFIL